MSCVLSPGHGTQRCSPVTSFPRILFCAQYVKEQFFHVRSLKLSSDARLSLPGRPTLQGMWTYLCAFRENLPKGTKKSVTEEGFGPIDPVIRNQPALSTELLSQVGVKISKNTPYLPL